MMGLSQEIPAIAPGLSGYRNKTYEKSAEIYPNDFELPQKTAGILPLPPADLWGPETFLRACHAYSWNRFLQLVSSVEIALTGFSMYPRQVVGEEGYSRFAINLGVFMGISRVCYVRLILYSRRYQLMFPKREGDDAQKGPCVFENFREHSERFCCRFLECCGSHAGSTPKPVQSSEKVNSHDQFSISGNCRGIRQP